MPTAPSLMCDSSVTSSYTSQSSHPVSASESEELRRLRMSESRDSIDGPNSDGEASQTVRPPSPGDLDEGTQTPERPAFQDFQPERQSPPQGHRRFKAPGRMLFEKSKVSRRKDGVVYPRHPYMESNLEDLRFEYDDDEQSVSEHLMATRHGPKIISIDKESSSRRSSLPEGRISLQLDSVPRRASLQEGRWLRKTSVLRERDESRHCLDSEDECGAVSSPPVVIPVPNPASPTQFGGEHNGAKLVNSSSPGGPCGPWPTGTSRTQRVNSKDQRPKTQECREKRVSVTEPHEEEKFSFDNKTLHEQDENFEFGDLCAGDQTPSDVFETDPNFTNNDTEGIDFTEDTESACTSILKSEDGKSSASGSASLSKRRISFPADSVLTAVIQDGDTPELLRILSGRQGPGLVGVGGGVDVRQANHVGLTALHHAVLANNLDAAKLLLCYGADPNAQDVYGFSPLHTAAACDSLPITTLLIMFGADVFAPTHEHELPVDIAKDLNVIRVLSAEMTRLIHEDLWLTSLVKARVEQAWLLFRKLLACLLLFILHVISCIRVYMNHWNQKRKSD